MNFRNFGKMVLIKHVIIYFCFLYCWQSSLKCSMGYLVQIYFHLWRIGRSGEKMPPKAFSSFAHSVDLLTVSVMTTTGSTNGIFSIPLSDCFMIAFSSKTLCSSLTQSLRLIVHYWLFSSSFHLSLSWSGPD